MANIKVLDRLKPCEDITRELFKHKQALYILSDGQVRTCVESNSDAFEDSNCLRFSFARVLGADSSQQKVFEVVAKDILGAFLEGYNGSIFAYGERRMEKIQSGIRNPETKPELDKLMND
ncbi:Kinesin-like protein KIF6 [Acropora cervicornis]|uniref:Kinesin-like protein KIF6 n=1 Tax=Acropora cervicornis TaxID=6130 RepID=A0AAD9VCS7_ACRCE|nr:Kinesin-like protein KIF6 [Acropora cervicornis]